MSAAIKKIKTLACTHETEVIGETSKNAITGTAGNHFVFKNTLCDAKYTVKSDKCVVVFGSQTVKNPSRANTYEFTDTGTDVDLYKSFYNGTC